MKNYYDILGVPYNASSQEVRVAYRKLSKLFHPDKNDGDTFYRNRFFDVKEAYDTLSNSISREKYDEKLFNDDKKHKSTHSETTKSEEYQNTNVSTEDQNSVTNNINISKYFPIIVIVIFIALLFIFYSEDDKQDQVQNPSTVNGTTKSSNFLTSRNSSNSEYQTTATMSDSAGSISIKDDSKTEYITQNFDYNTVLIMKNYQSNSLKRIDQVNKIVIEGDQRKEIKIINIVWKENYDKSVTLDYIVIKNMYDHDQEISGVDLDYRVYDKNEQEIDSGEIKLGRYIEPTDLKVSYLLSIDPGRTKKVSIEEIITKPANQKIKFNINRILNSYDGH